jgi:molybdenum cofactor cytidylyltransferase
MVITAIVLAAGASTRMGTHKLLLPLGGETVVRRTVREVCAAGFDDVLVVLGRDSEGVRAALEGLQCRYAVNADYETGLGSSFRTAVAHLQDSEAAMFALADQPFVTSDQYRQLREAFVSPPVAPGIVSVRYGDVTAPPQLFAREFFPELAQLQEGARPVLQRHADRIVVLQFPADRLIDVDTPEDYARAQALALARPLPR